MKYSSWALLGCFFISSFTYFSPPGNYNIPHIKMSVSIIYYRVARAEKIQDIPDLEMQIEKTKASRADLYKMTEDLGIIFSNSTDPYSDSSAIPYKILFGHYCNVTAGYHKINGFVPASEIPSLVKWLKQQHLDSFEGFSKMCDDLSPDAKQRMLDIGGLNKKELYSYVTLLTTVYFDAEKNQHSIVISSE